MTNYRIHFLPLAFALISANAAAEELQVGISVSDLSNPFFQQLARAAEDRASELTEGEAKVTVVSSAYDLERQAEQLHSFAETGKQVIMLSAASYNGLTESIDRLRNTGIIFVAVDVAAARTNATITTHNYAAGAMTCKQLASELNYEGSVAIVNGPQVSSAIDRVTGCLEVLDSYPAIRVVDTQQNGGGTFDGGFERMTHLLLAYPGLKGVFTINDPSALGAEQAALAAGRDDLVIVSVDGAPEVKERMRTGDTLIKGTAAQFPSQIGAKAAEVGIALARGEPMNRSIWLIDPVQITAKNVEGFPGW